MQKCLQTVDEKVFKLPVKQMLKPLIKKIVFKLLIEKLSELVIKSVQMVDQKVSKR